MSRGWRLLSRQAVFSYRSMQGDRARLLEKSMADLIGQMRAYDNLEIDEDTMIIKLIVEADARKK